MKIEKEKRPFTSSNGPTGDDEQTQNENKKNSSGTNSHQRLENKPGVEVDSIERTDAATRRVREELRVEQHGAANEIEAQEHWQREYEVDGHFGTPLFVRVRDLCRPDEREVARYWVYEAHEHFYPHLRDSLPCHCDAPVFDAVVDYKQLDFLNIVLFNL